MKVKLKSTELIIAFKHINKELQKFETPGTLCTISIVGDTSISTLSTGRSLMSNKDQFYKAKGRMVSLTKALRQISLTKEERRTIWNQYLKETKILK